MTPTRWSSLARIAGVAAALGFVVLQLLEGAGRPASRLPWTATAAALVLAVAVLAVGWPVRRWNQGHRDRPLDPLRAARTAVLAKAAALAGAALGGWYLGQCLVLLPDLGITSRRAIVLEMVVAAVAGLLLMLSGLLAERWCRLPEDDEGGPQRTSPPPEPRHGYSHERRGEPRRSSGEVPGRGR